jgi:hypothetical protein
VGFNGTFPKSFTSFSAGIAIIILDFSEVQIKGEFKVATKEMI